MFAKPRIRPELFQPLPDTSIRVSDESSQIKQVGDPARPWPEDKVAYFVYLDQIEVICGASRKQTMHGVEDLIVGDLFRLPSIEPKNRSNVRYTDDTALITLETGFEVGPADMVGRRIGSVVLMSGNAHTLGADLIQTSEGRIILALGGRTRPQECYTLIHLSDTLSA